MACCFGSKSFLQKQELISLEKEEEDLRAEIQKLEESIKHDAETKRGLDEELQSECAFARAKETDVEAAETERKLLLEEIAEASKRKRAVSFNPIVEHNSPGRAPVYFATDQHGGIPSPIAALSPAKKQELADAWDEAERLMKEITDLHKEVEAGKHMDVEAEVRAAEDTMSELRAELLQNQGRLDKVTADNIKLEAEQRTLEKEEEPLQEWVEHVAKELRAARAENAEMSKSLIDQSNQRAELQRDTLEAFPCGTITNALQERWLDEQRRENAEQKATLLEEIASQHLRRERFLEEAAGRRQETRTRELEVLRTKVRDWPMPSTKDIGSPDTDDWKHSDGHGKVQPPSGSPQALASALGRLPTAAGFPSSLNTPGGSPGKIRVKVASLRKPEDAQLRRPVEVSPPSVHSYSYRSIDPVRYHSPHGHSTTSNVALPRQDDIPFLSSPTKMAELLTQSCNDDDVPSHFKMPDLPETYSSGDDLDHSGYWKSLPDERDM